MQNFKKIVQEQNQKIEYLESIINENNLKLTINHQKYEELKNEVFIFFFKKVMFFIFSMKNLRKKIMI